MADSTTFVGQFPEFGGTDMGVITATIAVAASQLDPVVFGTQLDRAIYLSTADKLARSPMGNAAKLDTDTNRTVYQGELEELRMAAGMASPRWCW